MVPDRAGELLAAQRDARAVELPDTARACSAIVVVAADARGVVAEAITDLGELSPRVPVELSTASLPRSVGARTLVLVLADPAAEPGARLVEAARARGAPVVTVAPPAAPGGGGAAIASLLVATLVVLDRLGLVADTAGAVEAAHAQAISRAAEEATAREIARRIGRGFPLVLGVEGIGAAAARAFRAEYNLRAKSPASSESLPFASHVDVAGFGLSGDVTRQLVTIVRLVHDFEPADVAARAAAALEIVAETVAAELVVSAAGAGPLAQCCDLLLAAEQVARAAAAREGVDADAVPVLADLDRAGARGAG